MKSDVAVVQMKEVGGEQRLRTHLGYGGEIPSTRANLGKCPTPSGNDREDIFTWLQMDMPTPHFLGLKDVVTCPAWEYHMKLGGIERICVLVQKIQLDTDGDGKLSTDELENETSQKVVERALSFILNTGVVGALIFGVLYSALPSALSPSDISMAFFGDDGIAVLSGIYHVSVYVAVLSALWLIMNFVLQCTYLTAWFPNTELQLLHISEKSPLMQTVVASYVCIGAVLMSIPCCVAVAVKPWCGLVALIGTLVIASSLINAITFQTIYIIAGIHSNLRIQFQDRFHIDTAAAALTKKSWIPTLGLTPEEQSILDHIKFPAEKVLDMVRTKKLSIDTVDAWMREAKMPLPTRIRIAEALANGGAIGDQEETVILKEREEMRGEVETWSCSEN